MRIPIYCPTCRKFYPGPVEIMGGATVHFENVGSNCPFGHEAHFLDGTHSIQNGLLTVVRNRPEVLQLVKDLANQGLSGKIEPTAAVNEIEKLVPEISPTIRDKFGTDRSIQLLSLLVSIIACIIAYLSLVKPDTAPQTTINNITNNYISTESRLMAPSHEKQQAKKNKRKAQRKARKIGRTARRAK